MVEGATDVVGAASVVADVAAVVVGVVVVGGSSDEAAVPFVSSALTHADNNIDALRRPATPRFTTVRAPLTLERALRSGDAKRARQQRKR